MKTHWEVHPIALLFPPKTTEERAELKQDMQERVGSGMDPLESAILLYEGKILDGRHRDEIWMELAEENACGGFFAQNQPPTENFDSEKHGTMAAWMRAKSRNMVVRHIPADQRAAIFLKAVEAYPELKAVLDQIKEDNAQRQKEGKPLGAGVQRGNTAEQIADLAGVGATTVKQVKQVKEKAPDKFEEVAQGKTTAKKALKEGQGGKQEGAADQKSQGEKKQGEKSQHQKGKEPKDGIPDDPRKQVEANSDLRYPKTSLIAIATACLRDAPDRSDPTDLKTIRLVLADLNLIKTYADELIAKLEPKLPGAGSKSAATAPGSKPGKGPKKATKAKKQAKQKTTK
jgi:hypothetical protein